MPQALPVIDDRPQSADRVPTLTEVVELVLPVPRPGRVDDAGHPATPAEAAAAEGVPSPLPGEPAALDAPDRSTDPVADVDADAEPQAMADDFVLAGLKEDAVDEPAPAANGHEVKEAESSAPPAVEPPLSEPEPEPASEPPPAPSAPPAPLPAALPLPTADVDAVVSQVLSELTPRIDMLLESRLREALAPALARAADGLIRDTRANLAIAVRDLVQEAVDRALQRRTDV